MVVRHPASLEVVGGKKKVRTDRIDARRMVRAPPAWDGGDRDAMSRVRVPGVAEEDSRRLPPRRERLVQERRRLPDAVDGLLRLHGLSGVNPAGPGFRERPGGMRTGYGEPLPPELLAGTGGIPGRLELVCAEMKVAGASRMEMPGRRAGRIRPARPPTGRGRPRRPPTTRRRRSGCAGSARTTL